VDGWVFDARVFLHPEAFAQTSVRPVDARESSEVMCPATYFEPLEMPLLSVDMDCTSVLFDLLNNHICNIESLFRHRIYQYSTSCFIETIQLIGIKKMKCHLGGTFEVSSGYHRSAWPIRRPERPLSSSLT
jgi:hypothetical protein